MDGAVLQQHEIAGPVDIAIVIDELALDDIEGFVAAMFMGLAAGSGRHAIEMDAGPRREGVVELQIALAGYDGTIGLEGLELRRLDIGHQAICRFDRCHRHTHRFCSPHFISSASSSTAYPRHDRGWR